MIYGTNLFQNCAKIALKMKESTHIKVENEIKKKGRGEIFFVSDFSELGTYAAVRHALSRLCKSGLILRLAEGIYLYPKIDTQLGLGVLYPSIDTIAKSIAKKDRVRIAPTGIFALNKLGFSTQVPANAVYLTDGSPRKINIGSGREILFKRTVPKNLAYNSQLAMLIVFALKEITKEKVKSEHLNHLEDILSEVPKEEILQDSDLMPVWIKDIIVRFYV